MRNWAIIGCGDVGRHLAKRLLDAGASVAVSSRSSEGRDALSASLPGAMAIRYEAGDSIENCSQFDVVVISSPPDESAPAFELGVARQLAGAQRLIYLSTTGVYAEAGGGLVDDDYPIAPGSERSQRRLTVELALTAAHASTIVLRIPSIYGPGRGVHARLRGGSYRLIGEANTMVSRIYVDDLVSAIVLLGDASTLAHSAFVVGDEEPTTATEHARGVAEYLGLPMPPTVPLEEVSQAVGAMLGADRRVVPKRLHALGWKAQYPTWREGLIKALADEAGADEAGADEAGADEAGADEAGADDPG